MLYKILKIIRYLFILYIVISIYSFITESVTVLSPEDTKIPIRVLENSELQVKSLKEEIKFRNKVYANLTQIINIDSIPVELSDTLSSKYLQFLLLQKINSTLFKDEVKISIQNPDKFYKWYNTRMYTNLSSIEISFSVNKTNLRNLIENEFESESFLDLLRYGTFIDIQKKIHPTYRLERLIIFGISTIILIIGLFLWKKSIKRSNRKNISDSEIDGIKSEIRVIDSLINKLEKTKLWKNLNKEPNSEMKEIKDKFNKIDDTFDKIKKRIIDFEEITEVKKVIIYEMKKSENDTKDLFNRSTLMLVFGLGIAFIGVAFFYISLPKLDIQDFKNYIISSIRPVFILIFIESIAFYMLKQYRTSMHDYKFFYKKYENRINQRIMYDLLNESMSKDKMKLLIENLLNNTQDISESTELDVEITKLKPALAEMLKDIFDTMKNNNN